MQGRYNNIAIKAIAAAVPEQIVNNEGYEKELGKKRLSKHIRMTGVERRRKLSEHQNASDLAICAADKVLEYVMWRRDDIQALIYVTQVPDMEKPATAFLIQKKLGIGKNCIVFDVNLGCSGFVAGMQIIAGILHNSGGKGLLLIADGRYGEERKIEDQILFGDAGCAIAVEVEEAHELYYMQESDGTRYDVIHKQYGQSTIMNGNAVFAFTLYEVSQSIIKARELFGISESDIDYYVFHQGQKMIIDNLAEICDVPKEKLLYSIEEYGNTIGSSIPLTLCHNRELLQKKDKLSLFMSGFGVGLSWGSVFVTICPETVLGIYCLDL
ncbi:MAG: ketoacyl-ACP synthase III [Lachnospiraceae bacterium]|nr:ketoacyl-ACP synthase III [Lachnospiraceae bacterium]